MNEHTLAQYVRHAERFGIECVYETACGEWVAAELGRVPPPVDLTWIAPVERERILDDRGQLAHERRTKVAEIEKLLIPEDQRLRLRIELDGIEANRTSGRWHVGKKRRRSRAETQVAAQVLVDEGLTRLQIAEKMGVSVKTIDNALSPAALRATQTLRESVRGMKPPANEGVETGGQTPLELGSTMRDDDEGQMPLSETA